MWEPFGTQPANATAYWKPPPTERGTFGILSTCILTLLLCVYTSLHLNIPRHTVTKWYQRPWIGKAVGVVVGLLAPEVVAYLAFQQWLAARNLDSHMVESIGKLVVQRTSRPKRSLWSRIRHPSDKEQAVELDTIGDESALTGHTEDQKRNLWTRVHSHFALMGGFAFDADDTQAKMLPDSQTRLTLTPHALRKLAEVEPMLIPDLSDRAIKDKSKANWLAKALVCLQACWFILQVIGRTSTSAPISLLEMNTFLHALCCLFIYIAWWNKPLDIEEPELIKLNTERARKICAWMIMSSRTASHIVLEPSPSGLIRMGFLVHSRDVYRADSSEPASYLFDLSHLDLERANSANSNHQTTQTTAAASELCKLYIGQSINGFYAIPREMYSLLKDPDRHTEHVVLEPAILECLRLTDLMRKEPSADINWKFNWATPGKEPSYTDMVLSHISDSTDMSDYDLEDFKGSTILTRKLSAEQFGAVILLFAGSIYGLVHLIAWNGPFTTLTQRWMWRVSCIIIAAPAIIVIIIIAVAKPSIMLYDYLDTKRWCNSAFHALDRFLDRFSALERDLGLVTFTVMIVPISLAFLAYIAARLYILVECFINISQLPPEVYQVPSWNQYIPHLGTDKYIYLEIVVSSTHCFICGYLR